MKVETELDPGQKDAAPTPHTPEPSAVEDVKGDEGSADEMHQGPVQPHYYVPSPAATPSEHSKEAECPADTAPVQQPSVTTPPPRKRRRRAPGSSNGVTEPPQKLNKEKKRRNRLSAQKCRERKKEYILSLEAKIESLDTELTRCKKEIRRLKETQSANLMAEGNAKEFQAKYKKCITALENALSRDEDEEVLNQLINKLNANYGGDSVARRIMVDSLAEEMISFALPNSYKYLIWSAESGRSLFDPIYEKKKHKKHQKYLLYEQKLKIEEGLNDIWLIINPDEDKKSFLASIQPFLINFKQRIQAKVEKLFKAKNELMQEIGTLGNFLETRVVPKFWSHDVAKFILWVDSKKHEKELSTVTAFGLREPELIFNKMSLAF
eukprot:TRINITY_DN5720_c0_g7_i1.p1 TRINITY_DN5720_c0_g7~~TRINITY_DN5720_c0_g7_i1.p1  ORF type:complete len:380 (-),score=103.80 TRINITY_DN5720_c0_g7_i1:101-1240(-)